MGSNYSNYFYCPSVPPPPPQAYAITPEELAKYQTLFATYDTDKDGYLKYRKLSPRAPHPIITSIHGVSALLRYLFGAEVVPVFAKSGLDKAVLGAIWNLSDDDKDSRLNSREFAVAFHLILCVR